MEVIDIYAREDRPKYEYYHIDTEVEEQYDPTNELGNTKFVKNYLLVSVHKNTSLTVSSFFVSEEELRANYILMESKQCTSTNL